jgi:hypothetical protein
MLEIDLPNQYKVHLLARKGLRLYGAEFYLLNTDCYLRSATPLVLIQNDPVA